MYRYTELPRNQSKNQAAKHAEVRRDRENRHTDLDAQALEALGLADELRDFLVQVHVQPPVVRVAHEEGGMQPCGWRGGAGWIVSC
jgi:hypothetical protein